MFLSSNKNVLHVLLFPLQKIFMYVTSLNSTLQSQLSRYRDNVTFQNNKVMLFCFPVLNWDSDLL